MLGAQWNLQSGDKTKVTYLFLLNYECMLIKMKVFERLFLAIKVMVACIKTTRNKGIFEWYWMGRIYNGGGDQSLWQMVMRNKMFDLSFYFFLVFMFFPSNWEPNNISSENNQLNLMHAHSVTFTQYWYASTYFHIF